MKNGACAPFSFVVTRRRIDLTPGLYQRRMLYWHRFAPESRLMRRVTDALIAHLRPVFFCGYAATSS
jgi:hypothetical protein